MRIQLDSWFLGRGGHVLQTPLIQALMQDESVDLRAIVSDQNPHLGKLGELPLPLLALAAARTPSQALRLGYRLPLARRRLARFERGGRRLIHIVMASPWDLLYLPVAKRAGARILLTVHDAVRHPGEESRVLQAISDRVIGLADHLAVLSNHVANELAERWRGSKAIHVLHHGLATVTGQPSPPRPFPAGRQLRLLFFGRIVHYKGLDILLDAIALLRARNLQVRLTVAGSGDLGPYRKQILSLEGVTVHDGWISDEEKAQLFAAHDVNVLPYREASQSANALDGLWAAVPTVATRIGGLVEQLGEARDTVFAASVSAEAIADAIARLASEPALYERLSRGAHESAQEKGPKQAANNWIDLYREIARAETGATRRR